MKMNIDFQLNPFCLYRKMIKKEDKLWLIKL